MSENQNILDKLRKLIEHEKSARDIGSLHEADAFAQKISELCELYRIAIADVPEEKPAEAKPADDIWIKKWDPDEVNGRKRRQSNWQREMAMGIAYGHFCELLIYRGSNKVAFVGLSNDVETASAMMTILCRAAISSCDTARRRRMSGFQPNQFLFGFALAIKQLYKRRRDEQETKHSSAVNALVRQTHKDIRKRLSHIKNSRELKQPEYNRSMQAGYDAGLQQSVNSNLITGAEPAKQLQEAK